jgi:hypothetical protein
MKALTIALLVVATQAHAQAPACIPGIYGTQYPGSKVVPYVKGTSGTYAYWWCSDSTGKPISEYFVCSTPECPGIVPTQPQAFVSAAAASGVAAAWNDWFKAHPLKFSCHPGGAPQPVAGGPRDSACTELKTLLKRDQP